MGLFDKLKKPGTPAVSMPVSRPEPARETFTFAALPESADELRALPEAAMDTPYKTAALTLCALCAFAADEKIGTEMLNALRGPRPLSGMDISFLRDRFRGGRAYIPFSYFAGAAPANDYTPDTPYTVTVSADAHSFDEAGYARLYLASGGADSPRPIRLRRKDDGSWCLWEQYLLVDIRTPKSRDPWA